MKEIFGGENYSQPADPRDSQKRKKTIMRYQTNAKSKHYDIFCLEKGQNGRCQRPSVSGSVLEGRKCLVSVEVQLTAHPSCRHHTILKRAKPHSHSRQTGGRCSSPLNTPSSFKTPKELWQRVSAVQIAGCFPAHRAKGGFEYMLVSKP